MKNIRFFRCEVCGDIAIVVDGKVPKSCCGQFMTELIPGTTDAAVEKHVPVIEQDGNVVTVKVGSVEHPMLEEHHISFVVLQTCCGFQYKALDVDGKPEAKFVLSEGEKVVAAYEYCNLHGLWKAEA